MMIISIKIFKFFYSILFQDAEQSSFSCTRSTTITKTAIVDESIQPITGGRVRFQGSWWPARCYQKVTIDPGEIVRVIGQESITLIVEPLTSELC